MRQLEKLLASGYVWIVDSHYIGRASDGEEVVIGEVGDEERIEWYLASYPNPTDW